MTAQYNAVPAIVTSNSDIVTADSGEGPKSVTFVWMGGHVEME